MLYIDAENTCTAERGVYFACDAEVLLDLGKFLCMLCFDTLMK